MDGFRFKKIKRTNNSWTVEDGGADQQKIQELECSKSRKRKCEETVGIEDEENIAVGLINRCVF